MRPDREMAVEAMKALGWTAERKKRGKTPLWEFRRPDTDGLLDVVTVRQDALSLSAVAENAMKYGDAPDLMQEIAAAKERWLQARFFGMFRRASEQNGEKRE